MPVISLSALKAYFTNKKVAAESEFVDLIDTLASMGGGDMTKAIYDPNADGIVSDADNAAHAEDSDSLGGNLPSHFATSSNLSAHTGNVSNPHSVTAAQTGAAPSAQGVTNGNSHDHNGGDGATIDHNNLSNKGALSHASLDSHAMSTSNPHYVTSAQVQALSNQTDAGATIANGGGALTPQMTGNGGGAAAFSFLRPSTYAVNFGLDTDNLLKVGGWSMGNASHRIWHDREGIIRGNSFPTPSYVKQPFFRTDYGLWCFWDGTYWLTASEYEYSWTTNVATANIWLAGHAIRNDFRPFFTRYKINFRVEPSNDSTNYWVMRFYATDMQASTLDLLAAPATNGGLSASWWYSAMGTPGRISSINPVEWVNWQLVRSTGSTGQISFAATIFYRLVVT